MAFRFVLGRAGSGKTRYCFEAVAGELRRAADGPPLILLVPEQATFQTDRALVTQAGIQGTVRGQVLSFGRLAWRVLAETGGAARPHINETGKAMALRALMADPDRRESLRVFGRSVDKPGFVARLARSLSELHAYNIGPAELARAFSALEALGRGDTTLAGKLHDLSLVSRDLQAYLAGRWVDPDDTLGLLARRLAGRPPVIRGARVWVDGFAGFTAQELDVLVALAGAAADLSVCLCLDPGEMTRRTPTATFYPVRRTFEILQDRLAASGVEREPDVILGKASRPRFSGAAALASLESSYPGFGPGPGPGDPGPAVTLVGAESRRAEVAAAAREMVRLAREQGFRWREMSLVARSLSDYGPLVEATLADYGIPHFIDRRRPATYHPVIEFARSAIEVALGDWLADPLFRLLKTDLWPLPRADVDLLENYVLAHGLRGSSTWTGEQPWRWRRVFALDETAPPDPVDEEPLLRVDALRRAVAGLLGPHLARLGADGRQGQPLPTFRDRAAALWQLLEATGVPKTLESWSRQAASAGRAAEAQEHGQVLQGLVNLLDQMVTNLGERPVSLADFGRTIDAGLESLSLRLVPPSLDQVVVGAIDRSRQPDVRACFVLGLNDGVFPAVSYEDAVFDDRERADLTERYGLDLAPASRDKALAEDYLAYIALTRASERLWVSYSLSSDDGKAMAPSVVVGRLKAVFPGLRESPARLEPDRPEGLSAEPEALAQVARVLAQARRADESKALDPGWLEAYNWLVAEPGRRTRVQAALRSLGYRNEAVRLASQTAERLYGNPVRVSVSRLEGYAGCPFSHFASAGLGLELRPKQQLEAPEIGTYYHAVLNLFTRGLAKDGLELADLGPEAVAERLERIVEEVAPRLESNVLASRARYRHLSGRILRTLGRTVEILQEHARRGRFRAAGTEMRFARGEAGPGRTGVKLRGVVDRLEIAESGRDVFARVVDFKSSSKTHHLRHTESGLELQLPVYLLAATAEGTEWGASPVAPAGKVIPAGALFLPVTDPYVRANRPLDQTELRRERLKATVARGLFLNEPAVLGLMDGALGQEGSPGPVLPITLTKSGAPRKSPSLLSREQMETLLGFTGAKVGSLAGSILSGDVVIRPAAKSVSDNACGYCDYRPVCRFDPAAGERYHRLPHLKDDELWDRFRQGGNSRAEG